MKYSKKLLIASAITLATFTAPVYAEWRIGTQFGYGKSEIDVRGDLTDGSEKDNSGNFDVFGQWRTSSSNNTSFGVHLGYGQGGGEYEDSVDGAVDLHDFGIGNSADVGNFVLNGEVEQGNTLDLLGIVAWNRDGLTPYIMFGYTSVELDSEISITGSDFTDVAYNRTLSAKDDVTVKGYKLVAGVEGRFSRNWIWHAALEYADYGDEKLTHTAAGLTSEDEVELDQTNLRFGIAYSF